jgi:hypothetical protein
MQTNVYVVLGFDKIFRKCLMLGSPVECFSLFSVLPLYYLVSPPLSRILLVASSIWLRAISQHLFSVSNHGLYLIHALVILLPLFCVRSNYLFICAAGEFPYNGIALWQVITIAPDDEFVSPHVVWTLVEHALLS